MPLFLYLCHFDSQGLAAQDVEVQVENGLTGIRAAVGNHPVATGEVFGSGDLGNHRKNVGNHSAVFLCDATEEMWALGITKMWVGAWGAMSRKAKIWSSSYTFVQGMFPFAILQNKQSIA